MKRPNRQHRRSMYSIGLATASAVDSQEQCSHRPASNVFKSGALFLTQPQPFSGASSVHASLDIEKRVDALDRLQRDRRDRHGIPAAPRNGGEIRQLKELTLVDPTETGPCACEASCSSL